MVKGGPFQGPMQFKVECDIVRHENKVEITTTTNHGLLRGST